ncbi:hypothetical protein HOP50_07g48130 [Chloropicon primus]|uniref:Uncharacterized protein n=1 Tax=Chloropicon primus TaxID=1764295 RepID=A0A5B8MRJ8_9CHLO|nr:hypothetical protein A3770_07p47930 [Chloropicon primus]UPR01491.1 hypothetical protein HOP50_07g48130 [Chloropicon primus]|eukprot:QDZ22275.1 hypothetical protein A3770_07p47930 [Chloropicon primus]
MVNPTTTWRVSNRSAASGGASTSLGTSLGTVASPRRRPLVVRRPRASANIGKPGDDGDDVKGCSTSEQMRRLKRVALKLWRDGPSSDDHMTSAVALRAAEAETQAAAERSLLQARCQFMEEKIAAQSEYIRELNTTLGVAKRALVSAMKCLDSEAEIPLPDLAEYIPADQARGEEEETCDVDSFSNIENALWAADVLLKESAQG